MLWFRLSVRLTDSTAPHVRAELHVIRTGTGVFGGVVCDLWRLQTEVLTATIR